MRVLRLFRKRTTFQPAGAAEPASPGLPRPDGVRDPQVPRETSSSACTAEELREGSVVAMRAVRNRPIPHILSNCPLCSPPPPPPPPAYSLITPRLEPPHPICFTNRGAIIPAVPDAEGDQLPPKSTQAAAEVGRFGLLCHGRGLGRAGFGENAERVVRCHPLCSSLGDHIGLC